MGNLWLTEICIKWVNDRNLCQTCDWQTCVTLSFPRYYVKGMINSDLFQKVIDRDLCHMSDWETCFKQLFDRDLCQMSVWQRLVSTEYLTEPVSNKILTETCVNWLIDRDLYQMTDWETCGVVSYRWALHLPNHWQVQHSALLPCQLGASAKHQVGSVTIFTFSLWEISFKPLFIYGLFLVPE